MTALRIAHVSDTHLGYKQYFKTDETGRNLRALDIEAAYVRVVDAIISRTDIDLIVHTGDVFHQSRPSFSAQRTFIEQTRRLEALGVPIIVIAGNHDTPQLRTASTVFSVLELSLPGVRFVTGYDLATFDFPDMNLHVVAVPHGRLISGPISDIELRSDRRNILLTHGLAPTLADSPRHELGEVTLAPELLSPGYDVILLGHFHAHNRVSSNCWYAGSTERIGWNDELHNPCWSLVTLDENGHADAIDQRIPARQMITLGRHDCTNEQARDTANAVMKSARSFAQPDAMVRIELENVDRRERRSAEAMVRRDPDNTFLCLQLFSRQDATALFNEDVRMDDAVKLKGIADLFTDFCAEQPYDEGFRTRFLARGRSALETAIAEDDPNLVESE